MRAIQDFPVILYSSKNSQTPCHPQCDGRNSMLHTSWFSTTWPFTAIRRSCAFCIPIWRFGVHWWWVCSTAIQNATVCYGKCASVRSSVVNLLSLAFAANSTTLVSIAAILRLSTLRNNLAPWVRGVLLCWYLHSCDIISGRHQYKHSRRIIPLAIAVSLAELHKARFTPWFFKLVFPPALMSIITALSTSLKVVSMWWFLASTNPGWFILHGLVIF